MLGSSDNKESIEKEILKLESEHTMLDEKLSGFDPSGCDLDIQRMKRRKLKLKDSIVYLRNLLEDDIIA